MAGLWGTGCQPGHGLMDADLAAHEAGNDTLASCCLCELGNPGASIRSGNAGTGINERAGEGTGAQRDKTGDIGGEKSSTPPAKSTNQGQQAVNQARVPCQHLGHLGRAGPFQQPRQTLAQVVCLCLENGKWGIGTVLQHDTM